MEIEFCNYKWILRQPWGDFHPKYPSWWYDPSCVDITDDILRLQTKRHEREASWEGTPFTNKIGVGLVASIETFQYGIFEAEVMLPQGTGLFPAFWLWGADNWPPEIDIFEGWSRKSGSYTSKYIPYYSLASNVWFGKSDKPENIRSKSHMIWNKFDRNFNNFKLDWSPEYINIIYNNKTVRCVTDKKILDQYNNSRLRVIFNNGIEDPNLYKNDSVMLVKNFKYTPYSG